MRKQIIALAAASVLLPTVALATTDASVPSSTNGKQAFVMVSNDCDDDRRHGDKSHNRHRKSSHINYSGPVETVSLAKLKTFKWGDTDVIVEGKLIRQLTNGNFILSDGNDEVTVEFDGIKLKDSIDQNTMVRLYGEYEAWDKELEAEYVQIVK